MCVEAAPGPTLVGRRNLLSLAELFLELGDPSF